MMPRKLHKAMSVVFLLSDYNDIKEGDIIEAFVMETVER